MKTKTANLPISPQLHCFDFCRKFYFDDSLLFQVIPDHHCNSKRTYGRTSAQAVGPRRSALTSRVSEQREVLLPHCPVSDPGTRRPTTRQAVSESAALPPPPPGSSLPAPRPALPAAPHALLLSANRAQISGELLSPHPSLLGSTCLSQKQA